MLAVLEVSVAIRLVSGVGHRPHQVGGPLPELASQGAEGGLGGIPWSTVGQRRGVVLHGVVQQSGSEQVDVMKAVVAGDPDGHP